MANTKKATQPVEAVETIETPVVEEKKFLIVKATLLNVRKSPSLDAEIVGVVPEGEKLLMKSEKLVKGFYSIQMVTGTEGYVKKDFVVVE